MTYKILSELSNSSIMSPSTHISSFFFFNDTATTEIYTLSLHDALPICGPTWRLEKMAYSRKQDRYQSNFQQRSEEHTSELQSPCNLVCRLLLEKKKKHSGVESALAY